MGVALIQRELGQRSVHASYSVAFTGRGQTGASDTELLRYPRSTQLESRA